MNAITSAISSHIAIPFLCRVHAISDTDGRPKSQIPDTPALPAKRAPVHAALSAWKAKFSRSPARAVFPEIRLRRRKGKSLREFHDRVRVQRSEEHTSELQSP